MIINLGIDWLGKYYLEKPLNENYPKAIIRSYHQATFTNKALQKVCIGC